VNTKTKKMNSLDLIENDFKILSNELKKKNTNIKDVRALLFNKPLIIACGQGHKADLKLKRLRPLTR
jgi:hypothetical protein